MDTKILIALICLVLQTPLIKGEEDVSISKIENFLLPIQLGNAKLIYTKHTFLHYIDLREIIRQVDQLAKTFNDIKNKIFLANITTPLSFHDLSVSMIERTNYLIDILYTKIENLQPHIRQKRGLINGVGKLGKWLFGILDSDDEIKYEEAIKKLEANQKNIIAETNLQTSLYKKLIEHYNKSITTLAKNQEKIKLDLDKIHAAVNGKIQTLASYLSLQGIISQINLDCQNTITFIDNIENAITFAKTNSLHNSIVSSSQIIDMINHLHKIYDEDQIPKFRNILTYYQFLGTQVSISDSKLTFAIHFPILLTETFEFYHLIPVIQNHKMFTPLYPYLARKQETTQFENEECPSLEATYYCHQDYIPQDNCTIRLLNGNPPVDCHVLEVNVLETISEQITDDEVLIIPSKEEKIVSKCKSDQYIQIASPTLFKIPQDCEIWTGPKKFVNNVRLTKGKPFILPKLHTEAIKTSKNYQTSNITKLDFDGLLALNHISSQLKPIQEVESNFSNFSVIWSIFSILILFSIIFIIIKYKVKILSFCNKKKTEDPEGKAADPDSKMSSVLFET